MSTEWEATDHPVQVNSHCMSLSLGLRLQGHISAS